MAYQVASGIVVKQLPTNDGDAGDVVQSLSQEDILEKEMVTHHSILDWEISWRGEPGRLQSTGRQNSQTGLSY